jgi:hypothetical protein
MLRVVWSVIVLVISHQVQHQIKYKKRKYMINVGEVVLLKTSEEPCFVLEIAAGVPVEQRSGLSGTMVVLRRPIMSGEKGLYHVTERFHIEEVETNEERCKRQSKDFKTARAIARETSEGIVEAKSMFDEAPTEDLPN